MNFSLPFLCPEFVFMLRNIVVFSISVVSTRTLHITTIIRSKHMRYKKDKAHAFGDDTMYPRFIYLFGQLLLQCPTCPHRKHAELPLLAPRSYPMLPSYGRLFPVYRPPEPPPFATAFGHSLALYVQQHDQIRTTNTNLYRTVLAMIQKCSNAGCNVLVEQIQRKL